MTDYPAMIASKNLIQPAPRRVRGYLAGQLLFDTTQALYVWKKPHYPYYYIPIDDVNDDLLVDEMYETHASPGTYMRYGLKAGDREVPKAAKMYTDDAMEGLAGMVTFEWEALDAWFEEDEQVFVHPRNPYTRVDALRSTRTVHPDLAWSYVFPTRQLLPITGLVAFFNEKVDTYLDGELLPRASTHFFPAAPAPTASTNG